MLLKGLHVHVASNQLDLFCYIHVQGRQKRGGGGARAAPLFMEKFVVVAAGLYIHVVNINRVLPSGNWIVWVLFYLCIPE